MTKVVRQRFAQAKANETRLSQVEPILQALASKYGTNADDIESIAKEIVLIKDGRLLTHGTVPELVQQVKDGDQTLENLYMQYYGGEHADSSV